MTATLAHPITQPVFAWRFLGQPFQDWPHWVQDCCGAQFGVGYVQLVHTRRSGKQIVNCGERLVKDLDGAVVYYTDQEFRRKYRG